MTPVTLGDGPKKFGEIPPPPGEYVKNVILDIDRESGGNRARWLELFWQRFEVAPGTHRPKCPGYAQQRCHCPNFCAQDTSAGIPGAVYWLWGCDQCIRHRVDDLGRAAQRREYAERSAAQASAGKRSRT